MNMILLYIDPGTGSMLFAILIGLIGALNYIVRMGIVKLRFILKEKFSNFMKQELKISRLLLDI